MYSFTYRSCVGRRVSRSLKQTRFSSSKAAQTTAASNPAPTPKSSSGTTPTSSARIVSSWDNIQIPTREEILKKPRTIVPGHDRGKLYKPDLSYLQQGSPTSFASRLAASAPVKNTPLAPMTTPPPIQPLPNKAQKQQQRERQRRIDEAIAQRKAERLAREAAQAVSPKRESPKPSQRQASAYDGVERAFQRDGLRLPLRGQHSRGGPASRGGATTRGARGGISASRGPPRATFVPVVPKQTPTDIDESNEDISLEILEQGGDDKVPAEFRHPDIPATNLENLFGQSPAARLQNATHTTALFKEDQIQWMRETYGGDYHRLAPHTGSDFITEPRKLGPLKHAQLVLSKQRDVVFGARKDALAIVASAVSDVDNKAVQRA